MAGKKTSSKVPAHKLGANRNEMAKKGRKVSKGSRLIKDTREDRGTRQTKLGARKQGFYPGMR